MYSVKLKLNSTPNYMSVWFSVNGLSLYTEKKNIVKFS